MDLFNWDMACAVSCKELNVKLKTSIAKNYGEFSWTDNDGGTITGKFDGWEIVPGGSTQQLVIITPLLYGRLQAHVMGMPVDCPVDGLCPKLRVELAFVNAGHGQDTVLKFNLAKVSEVDQDAFGNGEVVVLDSDTNNLYPDDQLLTEIFCTKLIRMLVDNKEKLDHVFSELLTIPMQDDNSWMKLHLLQYAYNEKINGELGSLGVLGILENNPSPPSISELQLVFDTKLIRDGGTKGFLLSKQAFLKYVVMAGLPNVFKGTSIQQYQLDDNSTIGLNLPVALESIHNYNPVIFELSMFILDDEIILPTAQGVCIVVPGNEATGSFVNFSISGKYKPDLVYTGNEYRIVLKSKTPILINTDVHDSLAITFWIFGGWVVDALVQGIAKELKHRMFQFSELGMNFSIEPINFDSSAKYTSCGIENNFYMQD